MFATSDSPVVHHILEIRNDHPRLVSVFSCYSPVNNALSSSRDDTKEAAKFHHDSHVLRSSPMKHMKRRTLTIGI